MKKFTTILFLTACFLLCFHTNSHAQCTVNDATDCQCLDPNETDCDLLPDIQLSWFGILDVSVLHSSISKALLVIPRL